MSVIIRLQGLPWTASALDIRNFFQGLQIPPGGVHIIGGEKGDAFIAFSTDEDARQAMMKTFQILNGSPVQLLLSSKTEMQNVIDAARTGQVQDTTPEQTAKAEGDPLKSYDDPFYRGQSVQDVRGGYQEEYPKYGGPDVTGQGLFGNGHQQGYRDNYGNHPPSESWPQRGIQNRLPDESFPPETVTQFGERDGPRNVPPRGHFDRDGPPFDARNQKITHGRFQDPFFQQPSEQRPGGIYDGSQGGEAFDPVPPFGVNDPPGPMDRRPSHDIRRSDNQNDTRSSEGRQGRDREGRDGRDARDRRDRSVRDRDRDRDRDRSERDRSRSDRSERSRYDRSDRFDRSRRDQDRERRDHSEPRRDSREPRESRERPPFDDKSEQRNSPMSRPGREPPRSSPIPPGRNGPEHESIMGVNRPDYVPGPDQFPPSDTRLLTDDFQGPGRGPFPPRERPKSRFDQEGPPGRFGPGDLDRRPPLFDKDPDYRSDPRGPPGPRGRGFPPRIPDQGNGYDRDNRRPDFCGGPASEHGFPLRTQPMPPLGRGRGRGGPPLGGRPPGFHDEGYPRGPKEYQSFPSEDGQHENAPWDMDSRFPPSDMHGGPGHPLRSEFMDKRPGPGNGQKGLLGDAPDMFPGPRGPMDRSDMAMDHDGREPGQRLFIQDRPRPGPGPRRDQFGRQGEELIRGDDYDGRSRFRGREIDQRRDERGLRPLMPDRDRRRPDWAPDGVHEGRWPDMPRGPPHRPINRDPKDDPHAYPRDRPPNIDDQSRKRPRQPEIGTLFVHVKNLPYTVSYSMVRRFFSGCDIPYDGLKLINNDQGKRNGTAYIRFMNEEACFNALQRNGMDLNGRKIVVYRSNEADFEKAIDSYVPDEDDDEPEPAKRQRQDEPKESENDATLTIPAPGEPFIVKILNLPMNVTLDEIKGLLTGIAIAENGDAVYMEYNSEGSFTGTACLEVQSLDDYKGAMALEGKHMGSRILRTAMGSKSDMSSIKSSLTLSTQSPSKGDNQSDKKFSEIEKGQGDDGYPYVCIHLTGISLNATFRELRDFVSGLDVVPRGIQICHDGCGNPVGEGFIEFTNTKDCKESLKRDQNLIGSNTVTVKPILKSDMIQRLRKARTMNTRPGAHPQSSFGPGAPGGPHGPSGRPGPGGPEGQGSGNSIKPIPPGVLKRQWVYLRCSNLPLQVTIRELLGFFNQYDPVPESIRLHYTGDGNPTGNAVVGFPTKEEASKAMADLNGTMCRRNSVVIQPANS